ncbi:YhgE/Pip family protein [Saccharopolyspora sp. WRP15-2]|uniref:YhgE/Pip family protein n=1 Tax=Saccharopolyspora oryzae TaxID=2997343 RepID=A0ABT4V059_9PSEU|nr:YhgE/Pip family protein [Saccharopolyspora oryzae]MDA3627355.1 YhgE/Pip family protein [Saccharopolyspora oryzae]
MVNPFTHATRRAGGSVGRLTWIGLALVPVLVVGVLAWAFWAPMSQHGAAKVAVVNSDEPTTINGQLAPLGREMAAKLVNSTDSGYVWQMTSAEEASEGLADGRYAAAVTIPAEFSRNTASAMTGKPMDATRAGISVDTSPVAAPADAAAVEAAARQSVSVFNQQILEMLLDGFYGGFSEMHGQLGTAVDGARQLADGSGQLADGTKQLAGGVGQLAGGVDELAGGVPQLAHGGAQLADGAQQLSGGLNELHQQVSQMPAQTRQLADGAEQVAAGNRQMANQFVPLADKILAATDQIPDSPKLDGLAELAAQCPVEGLTTDFCTRLRADVDKVNQREGALDGIKDKIQQPVKQARDGFEGLAYGSEQVAKGTRMLADNSGQLVSGIGQLADGGTQLSSGAQQLSGGLNQLNGGVQELNGGVKELDGGVGQLVSGAEQVADGNRQFADKIAPAVDQLPNYTDEERAHLKTVASSPAALQSDLPGFGKSLIALLIAIAFWTAALGIYAVTRAVPADAASSRRSTWRLVLSSLLPGVLIAAIGAVVVSAALAPFLDLSFGSWAAFAGVTLLAALAFVALNQALTALFGNPGRIVSIAVLVLAAATGVVSTIPGTLQTISAILPTHGAVHALSAIVTGSGGAISGALQLAAWLVAGLLITVLATDRSRVLPAKQLRRRPTPPVW